MSVGEVWTTKARSSTKNAKREEARSAQHVTAICVSSCFVHFARLRDSVVQTTRDLLQPRLISREVNVGELFRRNLQPERHAGS